MTDKKTVSLAPKDKSGYYRWGLIAVMFLLSLSFFYVTNESVTTSIHVIFALIIAVLAFAHGYKRFGLRNMIIFFIITWLVSNTFESLSIATGFPFGHYHYTMPGPRLVNVPLVIMPAYFGMGYMSYNLSTILIGQYDKKLKGMQTFFVPFIAAFIMVMWDVVMDPAASTINHQWIWHNGGNYFGVPLSNYAGWFLVVYLFMQAFAIYLAKFAQNTSSKKISKSFWLEPVFIYGIEGISLIAPAFMEHTNVQIYSSTALVCVFTMFFVTILAIINLINKQFEKVGDTPNWK